MPTTFGIDCRADKYTCTQLDSLARDFLRHHFEKVVQFDGQLPNRVGLTSLSQTALVQILTDDNLELSSEVHFVCDVVLPAQHRLDNTPL